MKSAAYHTAPPERSRQIDHPLSSHRSQIYNCLLLCDLEAFWIKVMDKTAIDSSKRKYRIEATENFIGVDPWNVNCLRNLGKNQIHWIL